jgi:hypothetical protein
MPKRRHQQEVLQHMCYAMALNAFQPPQPAKLADTVTTSHNIQTGHGIAANAMTANQQHKQQTNRQFEDNFAESCPKRILSKARLPYNTGNK